MNHIFDFRPTIGSKVKYFFKGKHVNFFCRALIAIAVIILAVIAMKVIWNPCMRFKRWLLTKRSRSDPDMEMHTARIEDLTRREVANEYALPHPLHGSPHNPRRRRKSLESNPPTFCSLTTDINQLQPSEYYPVEYDTIAIHSRPLDDIGIQNPTLDPIPLPPARLRVNIDDIQSTSFRSTPESVSTQNEPQNETSPMQSFYSLFSFMKK